MDYAPSLGLLWKKSLDFSPSTLPACAHAFRFSLAPTSGLNLKRHEVGIFAHLLRLNMVVREPHIEQQLN
jgi:hypothetical protein